jgi:hypothetical protein
MVGRGLESDGAGLARVCAIAAGLSMIACARTPAQDVSEEVECRPIQRAALEKGFGKYQRNAWGPQAPRYDQLALGEVVLRVARGADACLVVTDWARGPGPAAEDPIVAIRLSEDGRTLWINNQLSETLGVDVFVWRGEGGKLPAESCPIAPQSVAELELDEKVESASISRFRFWDGAPGEARDQDCNRPESSMESPARPE